MMVCVSRRTDIPAFHSEWFMNRLRSGRVFIRNPFAEDVVNEISLKRKDVDCILFMSKDPRPMERHLDEMSSMGHQMLFQITINPYGKDMEPNVPDFEDVIASFRRISEKIGMERMSWRYDPVIFSDRYDISFHTGMMERMCSELEGSTYRCIFSFLSRYDKLKSFFDNGILRDVSEKEKDNFVKQCSTIASEHGIELTACCTVDHPFAVRKGCIDSTLMRSLGLPYEEQSTSIRKGCECVKSIDIGMYDTCMHDCIYCYANSSDGSRRNRRYDPDSMMLVGDVSDEDEIIPLKRRSVHRITDF